MSDYRLQRDRLVRELERKKGIRDRRVLEAMRRVPRHRFVQEHLLTQAYSDFALPIGADQTISQPFVVARMTEYLELDEEHSVLEIGTGSGYQTAILALLARVVYSIERVPSLAQEAIARMRELGLNNVKIHVFDGTVGLSQFAPYDRILVTAGSPQAPPLLLDQLAPRGRMVIPEGDRQSQRLVVYVRDAEGRLERREGEAVTFVPLIGRGGWSDD
ncbi:MAG: protein-L-isoaspartate(D-aspartate) O-methyltransferase [Acidobacteria bacterium]|nr:MAG: protein-L-isoaspartate(D-aspartate) O-methyltransferase [Acidobacteriota bacterium]REK04323.1 MAG: protein-L-isoaspartate(D-aspartate) O-methyltransferase [Acidobacteriota bacterium]